MSKVSFVIPCYNEEEHIERCVLSIFEEIYRTRITAEIIVVNNNCTDNTVNIAKSLGVKVLDEPKKGVVWARQCGYLNSKYDLIANIDADSHLPVGWLSTALEAIEPENVAAITGPLYYYDGSYLTKKLTKFYYLLARFSNNFIGNFLQGGNCMIRKKYLNITNGYDTSIEFYGEDTMTAKRLSEFGKIKFVPSLILDSSARRLKQQGMIKTSWLYVMNYFYVTFLNKNMTKQYQDFR